MNKRHFLATFAAGAAHLAWSPASWAQTHPQRPIRLIVPFPAGAGTDLAARLIGSQLQAALGQSVVVENKPGAGGSIGAMEVVRAAPDGLTLLFASNSAMASNVALLKNMPYDPRKELALLATVGENMLALMVRDDHPARNLPDLLQYARQRAGKLSAGYGSASSQVCIAILNKLGKLDVQAVPYKGIPMAVNDVLGSVLDFTFVDMGNALAQSKGRMRALGVTSATRTALAPDWPAVAETLPGFDVTAWFAMAGPAGMPREIADRLNRAVTRIVQQPDIAARLAGIGIQPLALPPAALKGFIDSEVARWIRLAGEANIEPQ